MGDIAIDFWKKYDEADMLKRPELLKPIVDAMDEMKEIEDEKLRRHCIETALLGYFNDLLDYCWEQEHKKKK